MRILHISADYPDPLEPAKTRAVSNLLAMVPEHEHRVVSINRIGWRGGIHALDFADAAGTTHRAVAYGAPGKGVFHHRFLERLASWIAEDTESAAFPPDLIHAHKLSVEAIPGARLAERWGIPLGVSLQGDSDTKIVGAKRDLRCLYRRIWQSAAVVFPFAPWTAEAMARLLGPRDGSVISLPCPGPADTLRPPSAASEPVIRSAFHLSSAGRKNAPALIRATAAAAREVPELRLEIIGGGDPAAFARLNALAASAAPGRVGFLGRVPNEEIQGLFNSSTGFAMVSNRESFGMVFSEALLAGCPCLTPKGCGIDGYLPEGDGVIAADPKDEGAIAAGLVRLIREETKLKDRLGTLQASGGLDFLRRDGIRQTYLQALANIA